MSSWYVGGIGELMLVALCSIHYTVVAWSYLFTTSISDGYEEVFLMEAHD